MILLISLEVVLVLQALANQKSLDQLLPIAIHSFFEFLCFLLFDFLLFAIPCIDDLLLKLFANDESIINRVRPATVAIKAHNCLRTIDAELLANFIQAGQLQMDTSDRQHRRLKELNIAISITRNHSIFGDWWLVVFRLPHSKELLRNVLEQFPRDIVPLHCLANLVWFFVQLHDTSFFEPSLASVQNENAIARINRFFSDVAKDRWLWRINSFVFQKMSPESIKRMILEPVEENFT